MVAVTVMLLLAVHAVAPASTPLAPTVTYASAAPWWWTPVVWLVTNCVTSYETQSWYDRVVCQRAAKLLRWLLAESGDVMCLRRFYDVVVEPSERNKVRLGECLIDEGLSMG